VREREEGAGAGLGWGAAKHGLAQCGRERERRREKGGGGLLLLLWAEGRGCSFLYFLSFFFFPNFLYYV